jgi:putative ABC transport system permease protein
MIRNFLKVAFRGLARYKGFTIINIAGLTLGLTACLLIGLFVWDEKQYDKQVPGGENVYRVYNEHKNKNGNQNMAVTAPMYATTLKKDFPEVEQATRVMMTSDYKHLFENGAVKLYEEQGFFVDSTFPEVFPLELKQGSWKNALDGRNSIVISETMAARFFGRENPVGKELIMNKGPYLVKAVFKQDPKFHLQFNFLVPVAALWLPEKRMESWGWQQFYTYAKLKAGTEATALDAKFRQAVQKIATPTPDEKEYKYTPHLQSLQDIHLYSANFKFDKAQRGNSTYVKVLTIIAAFIILIACFNFVNLATARSLRRAKEVGVRKAIGAERKDLFFQFIGETVLLALISVLIAVGLTCLCLPWLNDFTNKHISYSLFINPVMLSLLLVLALVVGILAGFYPAFVISGFRPVKVLKGILPQNAVSGNVQWLRHGLVVLQFSLSVLLIISAAIVHKQVSFMHNKDLGFNKEQIMFFPMRGDNMTKNYTSFKQQLQQVPGIESVSIGYGFPGDAVAGDEVIVPRNGEPKTYPATQLMVDEDYIKTLGLQLVAGRDFSKEMRTDVDEAFIINEKAVKELGFGTPQQALGQPLAWNPWGAKPDSLKRGKIIGVVKDFHYKSLYDPLEIAILQIFPGAVWKVAIKMKTAGIDNTISGVQQVWNRFTPDMPIEYRFLDDSFEQMYIAEDKLKILITLFTAVALFVGCLGLFGLAAYSAERRRKEVGIRKVLGASVQGVVLLLSKDFIKLVAIAFLIASPIAWYFMHQWLQDFAYRTTIGVWIFVAAAIVTIAIALITVSFQAIRAATANPVKSLRTE